jgi:hypothetical protein
MSKVSDWEALMEGEKALEIKAPAFFWRMDELFST